MTERIRDFLRARRNEGLEDGPVLVVDTEIVRENYAKFARALPNTRVFYAVKANPEPAVLKLLAEMGSCFDTASVVEIGLALDAGATPDRLSFGNTIKKERDIARALDLGVRLFAVDCEAEVEKIGRAKAATGAEDVRVFCRILCDGAGAEWPLSRKFGCEPAMAIEVLEHAHRVGLEAYGVSFHVGSQQRNTEAWDGALASASAIFRACAERGIHLSMVNLGGGFPTTYLRSIPAVEAYGQSIFQALSRHFGNRLPETIIEPGRGMVGNAGIIESEVVLVSRKSRSPIRTEHDEDRKAPCVLAGPTCDSADVLYEREPYLLPVSLEIGDKVLIEGTGAYTTTYSAVAFNGFPPLKSYVI